MENVELHFFHGFLGQPSDWSGVVECVGRKAVCHNLSEDIIRLGDEISFSAWTRLKQAELSTIKARKILIGYSLGGRLAMHLDPDSYDQLILLGAHPGLLEGHEVRLAQDLSWIEKFHSMTTPHWLAAWNAQPVFANYVVPMNRVYKSGEIENQLKALDHFSLGRQEEKWHKLSSLKAKVHWGCGENDKKFLKMQDQLSRCLGQDYVFTIPGAGHRVMFDNPQAVAEKIKEVATSV